MDKKKLSCLVCGEKIPLIQRFTVSRHSGAECPYCHSYMTFRKSIFLIQEFNYFCLFPAFFLVFKTNFSFLGWLWLLLGFIVSLVLNVHAEFIIDPAHKHRLKNKRG
jgi:hypothetical protein